MQGGSMHNLYNPIVGSQGAIVELIQLQYKENQIRWDMIWEEIWF